MKTPLLLRTAAVLTFLYFAGHTSGIPWTPTSGPAELSVIEAMKRHSFDVAGSQRTYWDFYFGFGVIISAFLLMQAAVLWQLSTLAKTNSSLVRPIVGSFFLAFAANVVLAWKYFFVIPLVVSVLISVCLALAFVMSGRSHVAQQNAPASAASPAG